MLAARPAEEELLLSLCAQVEEAAPWARPEAARMVTAQVTPRARVATPRGRRYLLDAA